VTAEPTAPATDRVDAAVRTARAPGENPEAPPGAAAEDRGRTGPAPAASRRAVVMVHNPVAPYSRALRIARSLSADGWEVVLAGLAREDLPGEERDGDVRIVRVAPQGPLARWVEARGGRQARLVGRLDGFARSVGTVVGRLPGLGILRSARTPTPRRVLGVLRWPLPARAWAVGLKETLPPADLYHACGVAALVAAMDLASDARTRGRAGRVVYDVIDLFLEGNRYARMPAAVKRIYDRRERALVSRCDAIVTVNEALAGDLQGRWNLPELPVVVRNCPPYVPPPAMPPTMLRNAAGLPATTRIVTFLGILGPDRGLQEVGEAVLRVPDAAFVTLGFGPWFARLRALDDDPRYRGRHATLPPVHPDDVPAWAAGADAVVIAVPGDSLNQRLSTPNKFWEGLTAGVPLVVGRDLPVMREIVEEHDLGAVADPRSVDDLARAIRSVLDATPAVRAARRGRALALARERFNWELQVVGLLELAGRLVPAVPELHTA
jgi:glycosyltransferase involved in cell wall biosynthesis